VKYIRERKENLRRLIKFYATYYRWEKRSNDLEKAFIIFVKAEAMKQFCKKKEQKKTVFTRAYCRISNLHTMMLNILDPV